MQKYKLVFDNDFKKRVNQLVVRSIKIQKQIKKTLRLISADPFYPSLKTHTELI